MWPTCATPRPPIASRGTSRAIVAQGDRASAGGEAKRRGGPNRRRADSSPQPLTDGKHDFERDEPSIRRGCSWRCCGVFPMGGQQPIERPLTPLLDTTVFTNAPGEPAVGHELRAEIPSADAIDVRDGVRPLERRAAPDRRAPAALRGGQAAAGPDDDLHEQHRAARARRARTARRADQGLVRHLVDAASREGLDLPPRERLLDRVHRLVEPDALGAGCSGSNGTCASPRARNPDAVAKMAAVFDELLGEQGLRRHTTRRSSRGGREALAAHDITLLGPIELELRPFQEALARARRPRPPSGPPSQPARRGHRHREDGDGRRRLRASSDGARPQPPPVRRSPRGDPRSEPRDVPACAARRARSARSGSAGSDRRGSSTCSHRSRAFTASDVRNIDPAHFDVVIVDEFHHAAAPSYEALLEHLQASRAARPDGNARAGGRPRRPPPLRWPDRRRAAAVGRDRPGIPRAVRVLRVHDGLDLREVPWRRGQGYDVTALENVLTADHAWARLVVEEVRRKVADPSADAGARVLRQRRTRPFHGATLHRARPARRRPLRSKPSGRA